MEKSLRGKRLKNNCLEERIMESKTDVLGTGCLTNEENADYEDYEDCGYVHLYKPNPHDWYGETKQYLYRVRDGWRKINLLRRKCRAIERGTAPVDSDCTDELHKKLKKGEQDMEVITAEVMDILSTLPDERQQMVMAKRYINGKDWEIIAEEMALSRNEVLEYHQTALPILKRKLKNPGGWKQ